MTILEFVLLAIAVLVSICAAYFFVAGRRAAAKAKEQVNQSESQARAEIRRAADIREAALLAKESAEAAARLANERAAQADSAHDAANHAKQKAEEDMHYANARAQDAYAAQLEAEKERDAAVAAKIQAENEFHVALAQARDDLRLAIARAENAEAARKEAENKRDLAIQERDVANRDKAKAEQATQIAVARTTQTEKERDSALEHARQANERTQIAQDSQKKAELERDEAITRARLAFDAQAKTERELNDAIGAKEQAEKDREIAIHAQRTAEASALLAIQKQGEAERGARLAEEAQRKSEQERDAALQKRDEAIKERESAESQTERARAQCKTLEAKLYERQVERRAKKRKKSHIAPKDRPGRRGEMQARNGTSTRVFSPEIVCRDKNAEWLVGIQLPEEFLNEPDNVRVDQGQSPLDSINDLWELKNINDKVSVRSAGTLLWHNEIHPQSEKYLLFQLSGYDLRCGTRVRALRRGTYLVVVPEDWERVETSIGSAPEAVSLEGYSAYYYVVDQSTRITFRPAEGESILLPHEAADFELKGSCLPDADQDNATLFGTMLPCIATKNANDWNTVKRIIVGEEGHGREDWKAIEIFPHVNITEQALPHEITNWQASWFFVRLYDHSDQLIDSMDFRLARGLREISINQTSSFPLENGHIAATIEFHHTAGCSICSLCEIQRDSIANGTRAQIPADIRFDETKWEIVSDGHESIEITVRVERIWWATTTANQEPAVSEWTSKPLTFTRTDFAATSDKVLWLRLPESRWTKEVRVGFTERAAKKFDVKVDQQTFRIELYRFKDDPSLQQVHQADLNLWVSGLAGMLAHVSIRAKCKYCNKFIANSEEEILKHLVSPEHSDTMFQYQDNLTVGLMICRHSACQFSGKVHWIVESRPRNLAICKHPECIHISHPADSVEEAVTIKFHVRKKFEESWRRRNVPPPFDRKCVFCNWNKKDPNVTDMISHLMQNHLNALYELI